MVSTRRSGAAEAQQQQQQPAGDVKAPAAANGRKRSQQQQQQQQQKEEQELDGTAAAPASNGRQPRPPPAATAPGADAKLQHKQQQKQQQQQQQEEEEDGDNQEPLDAFQSRPALAAAVRQLLPHTAEPTAFLQASAPLSTATRQAAQALYEYGVRAMLTGARPADHAQVVASLHGLPPAGPGAARAGGGVPRALPLPHLCVDPAFNAEQIWTQLEMAGKAALRRTQRLLARMSPLQDASAVPQLIHPQHQAVVDAIIAGSDEEEEEEEEEGEEEDDEGDEGEDGSGSDGLAAGEDDDDEDEDGQEEEDQDEEDEEEEGRQAKRPKETAAVEAWRREFGGSGGGAGQQEREAERGREGDYDRRGLYPTEDRFMRLHQMEAFLQDAERQAARAMEGLDDEDDDEEDELDLFAAGNLSDLEEDEEEGAGVSDGEGGEEDEEEAELRRALSRAAKEAGGGKGNKGSKSKKKGAVEKAMYSDFFGPVEDPRKAEAQQQGGKANGGGGSDADEDMDDADLDLDDAEGEGVDEEEEEDEEDGLALGGGGGAARDGGKRGGKVEGGSGRPLSSHQQRLLRLQEQIRGLEEQAMGDKAWQLTGEVDASRRPLNSALEVDLDFETTVRPAPEPTQEAMEDLEAMIKRRVAEHRFDDVVRVAPPPPEVKRKELELSDSKAAKGLAEQYEDDFARKAQAASGQAEGGGGGGAVAAAPQPEEPESKLHQEARAIFQALVAKLDALSHLHFAPKPVVEELAVRSNVAAVVMEEAVPLAVSTAQMQLPQEVYAPEAKGAHKAEGELSKEERKRRRAKRKRQGKAEKETKVAEQRAKALAAGEQLPVTGNGSVPLAGRKSAALLAAAAVTGKKAQKRAAEGVAAVSRGHARNTQYGKSSAVFAQIQQHEDSARRGAGGKQGKAALDSAAKPAIAAAALKL